MALYHSARGSVNYSVTGSPTIVDGVVSGFSRYTYLTLSGSSPSPISKIELQFAIKANTVTSNDNFIYRTNNGRISVSRQWKRIKITFNDSSNTSHNITSSTDLVADRYYFVKIILEPGSQKIYLSTNRKSYTLDGSDTVATLHSSIFGNATLGGRSDYGNLFFDGSIDLNNTYIAVNGQPWFGICPIEVKHINYGTSVGYTKVGSPTIVNGVASGFSASTYLTLPISTISNVTGYEEIIRLQIPSSLNTGRHYVCGYTKDKVGWALSVDDGKYHISVAQSTLSGTWLFDPKTSVSVINDEFYYIRFQWNGVKYSLSHSIDKQNWTPIYEYEASTFFYNNGNKSYGRGALTSWHDDKVFSNGSIDLNNTYIKVNGKLWFFKPTTNYLVKDNKLIWADSGIYVQEPSGANYSIVGSPTVSSGVISGFTNSDYAEIRQEPPSGTINSFDFIFSFNANSVGGSQQMLFGRSDSAKYAPNIYILNSRMYISMYDSTSGMYVSAGGNGNNLSPNTNYTFKATWVKDDYKVLYLYMKNGDNWVQYDTYIRLFTPVWDDTVFRIGNDRTLAMPFDGSIDLNNCSFTVNGDTWWPAGGGSGAKNYATLNMAPVPAGYTYGTTTTTAIGYVDIPTQAFTAAPAGSTIGRDE